MEAIIKMIDPEAMPSKKVQGSFTKYFTTPSWRTFMCLRCVHGYKCILRCISDPSLNIIIDLEMDSGPCQMFHKRDYPTKRMRLYHHGCIGYGWFQYRVKPRRIARGRIMREYRTKRISLDKQEAS